jgi:hypothetical protein
MPDSIESGPNTTWTFTVAGGVRPYRVSTGKPDLIVLSATDLGLTGTTFTARLRDPHGTATVSVNVVDAAGNTDNTSVKITSASVSPLAALPSTVVVYNNTPAVVTASGGLPPYRLLSSNQAIIPSSSAWSQDGDFLLLARNVNAETAVALTLLDSAGQSAQIAATVRPAPLLNVFTVTPVPPTPGTGCGLATTVCSGQDATASVKVLTVEGGPLPGRQVRFDVVQGQYLFYSDNTSQPLVNSQIVTSDQNGFAIVRLKANTNAVTGAALIRATDITTGNQVNGSFFIAQFTDGTGTLNVQPTDASITAFYSDECSSGVSSSYYIFGGTPPYRVVSGFPTLVDLVGIPVQTNGGGFTAITKGACVDPDNLIVTDATGRTVTVTLHNKPGTNTRPAIPVAKPPLAVTPTQAILGCGQSASFIITGGASTSFVAGSISPVLTVSVSGSVVNVSLAATYAASSAIGTSGIVNVSDGSNIVPIGITYPASCGSTGAIALAPAAVTLGCGQQALVAISGGAAGATYSASTSSPVLTATINGSTLIVSRISGPATRIDDVVTVGDGHGNTAQLQVTINPQACTTSAPTLNVNPTAATLACGGSSTHTITGGGSTNYTALDAVSGMARASVNAGVLTIVRRVSGTAPQTDTVKVTDGTGNSALVVLTFNPLICP